MASLRKLRLARSYQTAFWRFQHKKTDAHLATIEAIHAAYREIQSRFSSSDAGPDRLDDLLYYFKYQWELIHARNTLVDDPP
jgi:hypothetical protein